MNASEQIDKQIADLPDWRGEIISQLRELVHEAEPGIEEEWKWGTGIYSKKGMVCAISAFKDHVKINFFKGVYLPTQLYFNNGLDSKEHRSIDFAQEDPIEGEVIKKLVREAVEYNETKKQRNNVTIA